MWGAWPLSQATHPGLAMQPTRVSFRTATTKTSVWGICSHLLYTCAAGQEGGGEERGMGPTSPGYLRQIVFLFFILSLEGKEENRWSR